MLKNFKIPILDCTSDTDCQEPQPICNTASGKCHSCTDTEYSCTNAETCESQSGRCVNAGLIWNFGTNQFYFGLKLCCVCPMLV